MFLVEADINTLSNYDDIYYYKDKFYVNYKDFSDSEVFYKKTAFSVFDIKN